MGLSLKPIVGMPDGYYSLDLSLEKNRVCFSSLLEQSEYMKVFRINESFESKVLPPLSCRRHSSFTSLQGETGDVSQRGDWSSFRNSFYNNQRIFISPELFTSVPKTGLLTFDFSGSDPPPTQCITISDVRLTNVLFNVSLANKQQKIHALNGLQLLSTETFQCILGDGCQTPAVESKSKAKRIRVGIQKFYLKLFQREKQMKRSLKHEELKIGLKKGSMTSFAETDPPSRKKRGGSDSSSSSSSESESSDESSEGSDDDSLGSNEGKGPLKGKARKVSVVQEALALTLGGPSPSTQQTLSPQAASRVPPSPKYDSKKASATKKSSSSRIGFSSESKSESPSPSPTTPSSAKTVKRTNEFHHSHSSLIICLLHSLHSLPPSLRRDDFSSFI
jgi:hypothetical protein